MHPLVGEVNLHAVNIIDFFILIDFLYFCENSINVCLRCQIYAVLRHEISRISGTQLAYLLTLMRQMAQEKRDTHQSITSVVAGRIDHSAIAFATDDGAHFFHLGGYIHFAYGRSIIFPAVFAGHITQCTSGTQIGNRIARSVLQHIVGYGDQRIFFAIHLAVFANHGQTIHIRINDKSYIGFTAFHQLHNVAQVLLQRFGIMLEVTGGLAVEFLHMLHSKLLQQLRKNDSSDRIDTVNGYAETGFPDGFHIHQVECQHTVDMFLIIRQVFAIRAEFIHFGKVKGFGLSDTEHLIPFLLIQEFPLFIQEFQGIPLLGVVGSGQYDTPAGSFHGHCQFSGRSRCQVDVHNIPAHTHKSTHYYILHHFA